MFFLSKTVYIHKPKSLTSDEIGGYTTTYYRPVKILAKLDDRTIKDVLQDEQLHKQFTNIMYTQQQVKVSDIVSWNRKRFNILYVTLFQDITHLNNTYYKVYLKEVTK